MTMQRPQQGNVLCGANGSNNFINVEKGKHRGIEDVMNCALMFLFLISMKLKAFCVTQNETPKMVKIPPLPISCHIIFQNTSLTNIIQIFIQHKEYETIKLKGPIRMFKYQSIIELNSPI